MTRSIPRISLEEAQKLCLLAGERPETLAKKYASVAFYRTNAGEIIVQSPAGTAYAMLFSRSYTAELIGVYDAPEGLVPESGMEPDEVEEDEFEDDLIDEDEDERIDEADLASADDEPFIVGELHGVLCVVHPSEVERDVAYIDAVQSAQTYGAIRAIEPSVDDEDPDTEPPPDNAPFDLESHPMYREGEWRPFPSLPGLSESFYGRFQVCDNGGRVSSVEGFDPDDEEEIIAWLTGRGWQVLRDGPGLGSYDNCAHPPSGRSCRASWGPRSFPVSSSPKYLLSSVLIHDLRIHDPQLDHRIVRRHRGRQCAHLLAGRWTENPAHDSGLVPALFRPDLEREPVCGVLAGRDHLRERSSSPDRFGSAYSPSTSSDMRMDMTRWSASR
jgi:hypothetical protein